MRSDEERIDRKPDGSESPVDEASEESFPASDPPAWDPTHAGPPAPPGAHDSARKDRRTERADDEAR